MTNDISRDAYAVLLPAFDDAHFTEASTRFFGAGGVASLLGSTREEYVSRRMSPERQKSETAEELLDYGRRARALAGNVLIAIDYEIGGVHRLHRHGPQLAHPTDVLKMSEKEVEAFGSAAARAAKLCGINLFLAPILDLMTSDNAWLQDRTLYGAFLVKIVFTHFISSCGTKPRMEDSDLRGTCIIWRKLPPQPCIRRSLRT